MCGGYYKVSKGKRAYVILPFDALKRTIEIISFYLDHIARFF